MADDKALARSGDEKPPERPAQLPLVDDRQLELFKQFVSVQKDQIDLKTKEIALNEKQLAFEESSLQRNHEYALKALEAQTEDREAERQVKKRVITWSFSSLALVLILLAAFCFYALSQGKLEMVKDIMMQIFGTGGLGAAAFFVARSVYKTPKAQEEESEE
jgi:cation transport ATPase